ncbi:MAG: hypothetical protein HN345_12090 [Planctomycetaceae bacterium]|nr:hypothetical protein [Planctomycetaceae bacterium]
MTARRLCPVMLAFVVMLSGSMTFARASIVLTADRNLLAMLHAASAAVPKINDGTQYH